MIVALDGTQVLVAMISAMGLMGAAGLTMLARWLDTKFDQKAQTALLQNSTEHGETKATLQRLSGGIERIESKVDNHLAYHAHSPHEKPHLMIVREDEASHLS